jgi:hypothetical protein
MLELLSKKERVGALCRERCMHDGVCLTTVTGPGVRKREKLAVKRPGELLFRQQAEARYIPTEHTSERVWYLS